MGPKEGGSPSLPTWRCFTFVSLPYPIQVREQARYLDAQMARVQERQHRIETTLSLAPKVIESGTASTRVCVPGSTTIVGPIEHSGEVFCV